MRVGKMLMAIGKLIEVDIRNFGNTNSMIFLTGLQNQRIWKNLIILLG